MAPPRDNYKLRLQSANDSYFYCQMKAYLTRALSGWDFSSIIKLQRALSAKACKQPEFKNLNFDSDQRIYELIALYCATAILNQNSNFIVIPAWQKPGQKNVINKLSQGKTKSWDGVAIIIPKSQEQDCQPIYCPVESKSTMINPATYPEGTINDQAIRMIKDKQTEYQGGPQMNIIWIMPYAPELIIDLKLVIEKLKNISNDELSINVVCALEIGKNSLTVITAVSPFWAHDFGEKNVCETKKWIKKLKIQI